MDFSSDRNIRLWLAAIITLFFICVFGITIYAAQLLQALNHPWTFADWLINYQGGFVRRGLVGELVYLAYQWFEISPIALVMVIQISLYSILFIATWLCLSRQKHLLPLVPCIFAPFMFSYQIHDMGGGFRKEIIYLALIAVLAAIAIRGSKRNLTLAYFTALLFFPLVVLSHEMLILFLPYLMAIYFYRCPPKSTLDYIKSAIAIIPSILALAACSYSQGSEEISNLIRLSWDGVISPHESAIDWLAFDMNHARSLLANYNNDNAYLKKYFILFALAQLAFIPIYPRLFRLRYRWHSTLLCFSSLLGTVLLATVAIDWGRFIYINSMSLFFIALIVPERTKESNIEHLMFIDFRLKKYKWKFFTLGALIVILYSFSWHIPACCNASGFLSDISRGIYKVVTGVNPIADHKYASPPALEN